MAAMPLPLWCPFDIEDDSHSNTELNLKSNFDQATQKKLKKLS